MKEKFFDWFHCLVLIVARFLDRLFSTSKKNPHIVYPMPDNYWERDDERAIKTIEKIIDEKKVDKCILVCANCHREIHYYKK